MEQKDISKEAKVIQDFLKAGKALAYWSQKFLKANETMQKYLNSKDKTRGTRPSN